VIHYKFDDFFNLATPGKSCDLWRDQVTTCSATGSISSREHKQRAPIPAVLKHQISLRDERKCAYINPNGERCGQTRWLEVHHRTPVSEGGGNTLENLITLCSAHHDWTHRRL